MREEAVNVHIQAGGTDRQRRQKGKRTEEILKSMKYWTWPLTSGCWCMKVKRRCVCIQLDVQSRLSSVCLLHMTHVCFLLHSRVASVDKLVPDVTLPPVGHLLHSLSVSLPLQDQLPVPGNRGGDAAAHDSSRQSLGPVTRWNAPPAGVSWLAVCGPIREQLSGEEEESDLTITHVTDTKKLNVS